MSITSTWIIHPVLVRTQQELNLSTGQVGIDLIEIKIFVFKFTENVGNTGKVLVVAVVVVVDVIVATVAGPRTANVGQVTYSCPWSNLLRKYSLFSVFFGQFFPPSFEGGGKWRPDLCASPFTTFCLHRRSNRNSNNSDNDNDRHYTSLWLSEEKILSWLASTGRRPGRSTAVTSRWSGRRR